MTVHHLGIGELDSATATTDSLRTLALGSCIAIIMLDPVKRCVGMAHVALPDSSLNPGQGKERPGYFADTAIPALLEAMARRGASTEPRSLIVKLAGGASVLNASSSFDIGRRNALAIKRLLWTRRMGAVAEDLGGSISRTVQVDVAEGRVRITSPGKGEWDI